MLLFSLVINKRHKWEWINIAIYLEGFSDDKNEMIVDWHSSIEFVVKHMKQRAHLIRMMRI